MRRLALLLCLLACSDAPTGPIPQPLPRPPGAVRIRPLAAYAERYDAMEECAGIVGDFSRVRWYVLPDSTSWLSTVDGTTRVYAQWWPPHDIYVAGLRMTEMDVIDHEIVHELLQRPGHPVPPFGGVCAETSV